MKTVDVLIAARKLISTERKWLRGILCEDGRKFCAIGAIDAVGAPGHTRRSAERYLDAVTGSPILFSDRPMRQRIMDFNDDYNVSHSDVLAAFDKAIKNAKRRHLFG